MWISNMSNIENTEKTHCTHSILIQCTALIQNQLVDAGLLNLQRALKCINHRVVNFTIENLGTSKNLNWYDLQCSEQ